MMMREFNEMLLMCEVPLWPGYHADSGCPTRRRRDTNERIVVCRQVPTRCMGQCEMALGRAG